MIAPLDGPSLWSGFGPIGVSRDREKGSSKICYGVVPELMTNLHAVCCRQPVTDLEIPTPVQNDVTLPTAEGPTRYGGTCFLRGGYRPALTGQLNDSAAAPVMQDDKGGSRAWRRLIPGDG